MKFTRNDSNRGPLHSAITSACIVLSTWTEGFWLLRLAFAKKWNAWKFSLPPNYALTEFRIATVNTRKAPTISTEVTHLWKYVNKLDNKVMYCIWQTGTNSTMNHSVFGLTEHWVIWWTSNLWQGHLAVGMQSLKQCQPNMTLVYLVFIPFDHKGLCFHCKNCACPLTTVLVI